MFKLNEFVLKTIMGMIGNEPDYKIQEYALNWYSKSVLKDEDMTAIEYAIEQKNTVVEVSEVIDESIDSIDETLDNMEIEENFDIEEVTPEEPEEDVEIEVVETEDKTSEESEGEE